MRQIKKEDQLTELFESGTLFHYTDGSWGKPAYNKVTGLFFDGKNVRIIDCERRTTATTKKDMDKVLFVQDMTTEQYIESLENRCASLEAEMVVLKEKL